MNGFLKSSPNFAGSSIPFPLTCDGYNRSLKAHDGRPDRGDHIGERGEDVGILRVEVSHVARSDSRCLAVCAGSYYAMRTFSIGRQAKAAVLPGGRDG